MWPGHSQILPFLIAALVVFAVYRRLRRSFGRQPLQPRRIIARIVLLSAAVCVFLPLALHSPQFMAAEILGGLLGIGLGAWGAKRTRFVMSAERMQYVPPTYTGVAVTLLVLGRLVFRAVQIYTAGHGAPGTPAAEPSGVLAAASMGASSLTAGIFFVLAGYYLCFYAGVLWKSKHLAPADIGTTPAAAARRVSEFPT